MYPGVARVACHAGGENGGAWGGDVVVIRHERAGTTQVPRLIPLPHLVGVVARRGLEGVTRTGDPVAVAIDLILPAGSRLHGADDVDRAGVGDAVAVVTGVGGQRQGERGWESGVYGNASGISEIIVK